MYNALSGYAPAPIDPRIAFWRQPATWPDDCKGYIFAARAILELGRALYADEWSDAAPATDLVWELPKNLTLYTPLEDVRRGVALLERSETSYVKKRPTLSLLSLRPDVFPTDAEWAEAVELSKDAANRSWANYSPFANVAESLAAACKDGRVKTATRPAAGGALDQRDWHFWNSESLWFRFISCKVDAENPFARDRIADGGHWLFVERSSFRALVAGGDDKSVSLPTSNDATLMEAARRGRRRGRPPIHDWEAYAIQFGKMVEAGEITVDTSASGIAQKLLDWACLKWEHLPESSTVQEKIRDWRASARTALE